jgi:hypothetical protein
MTTKSLELHPSFNSQRHLQDTALLNRKLVKGKPVFQFSEALLSRCNEVVSRAGLLRDVSILNGFF